MRGRLEAEGSRLKAEGRDEEPGVTVKMERETLLQENFEFIIFWG